MFSILFVSLRKPLRVLKWVIILTCIARPLQAADSEVKNMAGEMISKEWTSTTADGKQFAWNEKAKAHVVCFLGCECPVARFYAARLTKLSDKYRDQGITFVGVMSNLHDSNDDILTFSNELKITFPLIRDANQEIAKSLNATRTAEVVVLDSSCVPIYRGRVDDQMSPGVKRSEAKQQELLTVLDEICKPNVIPFSMTEPVGCLLAFEKKNAIDLNVTYCRDVAPIFYRNCYECHRKGDIGPFDIGDYDEVRGWADMIVEVIDNKRMPPWHASGNHVGFRNSRAMITSEIETVRRWVAAGSPFGDVNELLPLPNIREGWRLPREPDLIVAMRDRPYRIPAAGTIDYQYFVVDPKLTEDKWISAAQVIPGNASIVHHAIVFIRPPDGADFKGINWLTAFVPGQRPTVFPDGYARLVPAGSKFVFQMHYTPNGTEQTDVTQIGMNFVDLSSVTHEVSTIIGIDQSFEIPPNTANHVVHGTVSLPHNGATLLAISPHMHLRGKSFLLQGVSTDDTIQSLLEVPRYDFNWQHTYELADPIPLSSLSRLEFDVTFDNSIENPSNPNPSEYVMWGDQTWEEMAVVFFEVASPRAKNDADPILLSVGASSISTAAKLLEPSQEANQWADAYFTRFDLNFDGNIAESEVSDFVRRYAFNSIDTDKDLILTRDELVTAYEVRRGR